MPGALSSTAAAANSSHTINAMLSELDEFEDDGVSHAYNNNSTNNSSRAARHSAASEEFEY
jgi:hypothetical protein